MFNFDAHNAANKLLYIASIQQFGTNLNHIIIGFNR
jgi:hypothetical protein